MTAKFWMDNKPRLVTNKLTTERISRTLYLVQWTKGLSILLGCFLFVHSECRCIERRACVPSSDWRSLSLQWTCDQLKIWIIQGFWWMNTSPWWVRRFTGRVAWPCTGAVVAGSSTRVFATAMATSSLSMASKCTYISFWSVYLASVYLRCWALSQT